MSQADVTALMGEPDEKKGDVLLWRAATKGVALGKKGLKRSKHTSQTTFAVILKEGKAVEKIKKAAYLQIEDIKN